MQQAGEIVSSACLYLVLRGLCLFLPDINSLENHYFIFGLGSLFFVFVVVFVSDNKVSPIPTTPSCPQVEVPRDPGNGDLFKKMWV